MAFPPEEALLLEEGSLQFTPSSAFLTPAVGYHICGEW